MIDAAQFAGLLRAAGYDPQPYSGRYMYGAQCVAITQIDDGGWRDLVVSDLAMLGWNLARVAVDELEDEWAVESVERPLSQTRTDSLGLGIVAYWPGELWPAGLEATATDDDEDEEGIVDDEV